ncbi:prostaglandin reductase 1-like [Leptidea sinapis]|uniref:prostaglandin reductase 1-like n=1 Tax=Leptidea sinapis TaxID=189913 RepID=UPI002127F092|nr:prostaglandin reductase 1-like [Leptidea sinapis]XP_050680028.1 prostaglandin reductase 1-like [Leptidea sinapis]XP_050680029.1 prostaglandin reductase 1-like [Leptidea sinapis]XP_050680030.1 prostaglandin reductase 1-like [Leptidea sinapis]
MSGLYSLILVSRRLYSSTSHHHIKAQKYVLTKYFQGEPKKSNFKIIEEELPELKNGEILTQAEFLSVDPYMRAYMIGYKLPTDMIGGQVAKVIASRNDKFSVGSHVCGAFGWRTHTVCNPDKLNEAGLMPTVLVPDITPHPVSLALGILGMPGNTAYFGVKEICQPQPGETIVITGAAGAVGSHVGQIAKKMGCRVIGFAGSDDKCNYLEKELGFDRVYNYKTTDIRTALKDGAPKRVDCYFDNVGGEISTTIMSYMNKYGRVAVCGSISSYNDLKPPKVSIVQPAIVFKELKVEGFLVNRWFGRWNEGVEANRKWLNDGSLKYQEKVYNGFENMVDALNGILRGENIGKAVVKINK